MGTSVSQPSPKTAGWNSVATCYRDAAVPDERVATEIWRAAIKQDSAIYEQLISPTVEACLTISDKALTPADTVKAIQRVRGGKGNTLLGELAKRVAIVKAGGGFPKESAAAVLFRQITDYLVSRDIAGYIGPSYRFKNIADIRAFKQKVGNVVAEKISQVNALGMFGTGGPHRPSS